MQEIGCPETAVPNYQSALRNMPEEWRSLLPPHFQPLWSWPEILNKQPAPINEGVAPVLQWLWNLTQDSLHQKSICTPPETEGEIETVLIWTCIWIISVTEAYQIHYPW